MLSELFTGVVFDSTMLIVKLLTFTLVVSVMLTFVLLALMVCETPAVRFTVSW